MKATRSALLPPVLSALCASVLWAAPAAAQASFTTFGTGCTFDRQTLAIGNQGLPQIGTTMQITYAGPNATFSSAQQILQPVLALGFGLQNTPIPQGLFPQQPPGCTGLIRPDALLPSPPDPILSQFLNQLPLAIPNDPTFIGISLNAQWVTLLTQCGFAGCFGFDAVLTSDGAILTIGP